MKKYLAVLSLLLALFAAGCESQEAAAAKTAASFANPVCVGEVKGQKLYLVVLHVANGHNHYIYFFDNNPAVTVNHAVTQGKTTVNTVQVLINGKPVLETNLVEDPK